MVMAMAFEDCTPAQHLVDTSVARPVAMAMSSLLEDTEAIEPYSADTIAMDCHWYSNGTREDKSEQNHRSACSSAQFEG